MCQAEDRLQEKNYFRDSISRSGRGNRNFKLKGKSIALFIIPEGAVRERNIIQQMLFIYVDYIG